MKIAVVTMHTRWAGCEIMWSGFANYVLANQLADVSVWTLRGAIITESDEWAKLLRLGAKSYEFGNVNLSRSLPKRALRRIGRTLRIQRPPGEELATSVTSSRPDVVIISLACCFSLGPLFELANECRRHAIPYVIINQNFIDHNYPPDSSIARLREAYCNAHSVVLVSHSMRRQLEEGLGEHLTNTNVIYNFVDLHHYVVQPFPKIDSIVMSCVARLDPQQKGQHILFAVLSDARWRERDWHLHLYGDGSHRRMLERLSRYYGIDNKIAFRGFVKDVRVIWRDSHLMMLPSLYEGVPVVLMEAWASGRPVVCSATGGAIDLVKENKNGWLHCPGSSESLNQALERAWNRRKDWESIGMEGRRTVEQYGDAAKNCRALYQICERTSR